MTKRVLLFPLGWKVIANVYKNLAIPAKYKKLPGFITCDGDDYTIFDSITDTPVPEKDDAKIQELLGLVAFHHRASWMTWLYDGGEERDACTAFHAGATIEQAQSQFEQDGYEVVLCETAESTPPAKGPVDLEKTLERVSMNLLSQERVPADLKALWEAQVAGDGVIADTACGEITLFDVMPADLERDFIAGGPGILTEAAFIGREAGGGFLGLWRYDPNLSADKWPVIHLDSDGTITMPARSLQQLFEQRDPRTRAWFKAHGVAMKTPREAPPDISSRVKVKASTKSRRRP